MHPSRSFLTVLFLFGSLALATPVITADDTSPPVTRQEVAVVRQLAIALTAGSDAIQDLRGPPIENSNLVIASEAKAITPDIRGVIDSVVASMLSANMEWMLLRAYALSQVHRYEFKLIKIPDSVPIPDNFDFDPT